MCVFLKPQVIIKKQELQKLPVIDYGKPKGSLRVATTRCFRKQRVALASQQEWSFCQRVAFESNALLKDIGVFINSTL